MLPIVVSISTSGREASCAEADVEEAFCAEADKERVSITNAATNILSCLILQIINLRFLSLTFNSIHAPCESLCRALCFLAKMSARVPLQRGVALDKLHSQKFVFKSHAVAYAAHSLIAAMLLAVAKTQISAFGKQRMGLGIEHPFLNP